MSDLYSTLPEKPVVNEDLKRSLNDFLKARPNQWFNVKQLCEATGFNERDPTKPTIRLACKELLHFQREPIISSHAGFCYATKKVLIEHFKGSLQARIQGLIRTVNDVDKLLSDSDVREVLDVVVDDSYCDMSVNRSHSWVRSERGLVCMWCHKRKLEVKNDGY